MLIGESNVSVSIDLCFEKKALIPFPTMGALIVGDAFHSIVKWSNGLLQHINEMQYEGVSMHEADKATGALEAQCNGMSYKEVGEVGELSEIFQWKGEVPRGLPDWNVDEKEHLGEELSDVLLYLVRLADICDVNLGEAALRKLKKNALKYPVERCKGSSNKYSLYKEDDQVESNGENHELEKEEILEEEEIDVHAEERESANFDVAEFKAPTIVDELIGLVEVFEASMTVPTLPFFYVNEKDYLPLYFFSMSSQY
ncbi:hypothetical protein L7F22_026312 [Adiantum nelumboides]|nr:hypothetical protein [Adiantum nelumboides]